MKKTEQTIRFKGQWVKITKQEKTFTFARGYNGQLVVHDIKVWPISIILTWGHAIELAKEQINS